MRQRGRKSQEAKAVISLVDVSHYRPEAPEYLTEDQQKVWCDIVNSMRPGSFVPSTYPCWLPIACM
jgi:hypothetical protein